MDERQRKRAWKPKVRTGCITCKVRRIKCDEAKPACRRCSSTGRRCDGYETTPNVPAAVSRRLGPTLNLDNILIRGTTKEVESLRFFYGQTAPEFAGFFASSFWQRDLPQAASHHNSLRTAVIGLGAMHRKFVDVKMHALPSDLSDAQTTFALEYCNRAIREIIDGKSVDIVMTMTFCVLFHCFAWLQGHLPIALSHLRGGLKILQEVDAGKIEVKQSNLHPISFQTLRTIFVNLDMQVRAMMNQDQLPFWEPKPKSIPREVPTHFTSFDQARAYIEEAFNEICSFLQLMDMGPNIELEITQEEIQRLIKHYEKGDQLLTDYLSRPSTNLDEQQQKSLLILNMCRHQVDIFVQIYCGQHEKTEMLWDTAEESFRKIIVNARQVLEGRLVTPESEPEYGLNTPEPGPSATDPSQLTQIQSPPSATSMKERPVMTFSMGIVSSLWTVAFRCRDPDIRRDAIELMVNHPRREGFWDGTMGAKIAMEVLSLEEQSCMAHIEITGDNSSWKVQSSSDIPEQHRVSSVAIHYAGLRSANVKYTTVQDRIRRTTGVVRPLTW